MRLWIVLFAYKRDIDLKRFVRLTCLVLCMLTVMQCMAISTDARPVQRNEKLPVLAGENSEQVAQPVVLPKATVPEETVPAEIVEEPVTYPITYDEVPMYFQNDYPDQRYGYGTVATHGSSITALAMVATYMTAHTYLPDELAGYFGAYDGNDMERLEYASNELQLSWRKASDFHDALRAMEDGKVVIALMNSNSYFTQSYHYVVFAGMDVSGRVIVNDPKRSNYDHWRLVKGFSEGFPEGDVCTGFSGGWIYDKSAMPSDPFIYEVKKETVECRYPDLELSNEDKELFARLLWQEARGETLEGQQACAEVILNRLVADNFPDTMRGIVYAPGQFPDTDKLKDAAPTHTQYEAIERALNGPYLVPIEVVFYARFKVNDNYWGQIGDHYFCYQYDWAPAETEATEPSETTETTETSESTEPTV